MDSFAKMSREDKDLLERMAYKRLQQRSVSTLGIG